MFDVRKKLTGMVCIIFVFALCLPATTARAGTEDEFKQLERDIPSLYLINGLFLTPEQNDQLAQIIQQVATLNQETARDLERIKKKYERTLERTQKEQLRQLQRQINGKKTSRSRAVERSARMSAKKRHNFEKSYQAKREKIARQALDMLTPAQQEIITSFKPCFIPDRDFRNPVRVGQAANDTGFGEKVFIRLRKVDEAYLPEAKERALEHIVPYVMQKRHMKYSDEAKEELYEEIAGNLNEALPKIRMLSDVDYELEKSELVLQVMPIDCHPTPEGKHADEDAVRKISRFVVNSGCLDIIASRGTSPVNRITSVKSGEHNLARHQLKGMEDREHTIRTLSRLHLTREQAELLLPIIQEGVKAQENVQAEMEKTARIGLHAYSALKTALGTNSETKKLEKTANYYHGQIKNFHEVALYDAIKPYEREVDTILSEKQVKKLMQKPEDYHRNSSYSSDTYDEGRSTKYGRKYHRGEPVPELDNSTQILFSQETIDVLYFVLNG